VLIGVVLFVVAFPLLWWNEGRAVQTAKSLEEGASAVVSASPEKVDSANEGKLVHLTGEADTEETLTDGQFGVSARAIQLARDVEMYQWKENAETKTERKTGGSEETTTKYTYERVWSDSPIDSSGFKKPEGHQNPSEMPYRSASYTADKVTLGAFSLSQGQIGRIDNWEKIPATEDAIAGFPEEIRNRTAVRDDHYLIQKEPLQSKNSEEAGAEAAGNDDGGDDATPPAGETEAAPSDEAEAGDDDEPPAETAADSGSDSTAPSASTTASEPQIGDLRVSFSVVKPTTVSLIASQLGDTFGAYQTEAGDKLDMLQVGAHSADSMFQAAMAANRTLTWILRLVGFLAMLIGVAMVFRPLAVLADFIPLLGDLLRTGTALFAFAVAAPLSLLTIAIAWVFYRPLLGICLIVVAVVIVVGLVMIFRKKKAAPKA
jgi:hypothetical protein